SGPFLHDTNLLVTLDQGVLANDSDSEGNLLTASQSTGPAMGTLALNPSGSYTYTPNSGFIGTDLFTYQANNGLLSSNVTAGILQVVDPPPLALDDSYTITHDTPFNVPNWQGILANDSSPNGDPLTISLVAPVTHGTLTLNPQGSFQYVPDLG